jgi:hypothetical protein
MRLFARRLLVEKKKWKMCFSDSRLKFVLRCITRQIGPFYFACLPVGLWYNLWQGEKCVRTFSGGPAPRVKKCIRQIESFMLREECSAWPLKTNMIARALHVGALISSSLSRLKTSNHTSNLSCGSEFGPLTFLEPLHYRHKSTKYKFKGPIPR